MNREGYELGVPGRIPRPTIGIPFIIASIQDNFLVCHPIKPDGTANTTLIRSVLKPWTLQKSEYDGKTVVVITTAGPINVTYTYVDPQTRTATSPGKANETHRITPDYVAGQKISAIPMGMDFKMSDGSHAYFIDLNLDGRTFAVDDN